MGTKAFKDLQTKWYEKLKESGFEDCEKGDSLKKRSSNSYRQTHETPREIKLEYYLEIGSHLHDMFLLDQFSLFNYCNELIMHLHSEGFTISEIVRKLSSLGISKERKTIRYTIRRHQKEWGIKNWSLKQLRLKRAT